MAKYDGNVERCRKAIEIGQENRDILCLEIRTSTLSLCHRKGFLIWRLWSPNKIFNTRLNFVANFDGVAEYYETVVKIGQGNPDILCLEIRAQLCLYANEKGFWFRDCGPKTKFSTLAWILGQTSTVSLSAAKKWSKSDKGTQISFDARIVSHCVSDVKVFITR